MDEMEPTKAKKKRAPKRTSLQELTEILQVLREHGVTRFSDGELSIELGELPKQVTFDDIERAAAKDKDEKPAHRYSNIFEDPDMWGHLNARRS